MLMIGERILISWCLMMENGKRRRGGIINVNDMGKKSD